jgi:hypothetical protein
MNGWSEAKITQDSIRMLFPESWQFWVPLHSRENRNHESMRDSRALLMDRPPFIERLVWADIETLLWGGSFRKCIRHTRLIDNKVFSRRNPIEDSRASLIQTISISLIKNPNLSLPHRPITGAAGFLATIYRFNTVRPHQIENCLVRFHCNR